MLTRQSLQIRVLTCIALLSAGSAVAQTSPNLPISAQFNIAAGVVPADSQTTNPGKPGIGFDGTNFLVVYCRETGGPKGIYGAIVSRERVIAKTFQIADINPIYGCSGRTPTVGFDGTNYLVAFSRITSTGSSDIIGMRVTPSGDLLDTPDGFTIFSNAFENTIAFDGTNYLIASVKFSSDTLHDIYGARVSPAGQVLNEFPIFIAPGGQVGRVGSVRRGQLSGRLVGYEERVARGARRRHSRHASHPRRRRSRSGRHRDLERSRRSVIPVCFLRRHQLFRRMGGHAQ
jgi:hypothetical protein